MKYGDLGKMSWNMFCFVGTRGKYLCEIFPSCVFSLDICFD